MNIKIHHNSIQPERYYQKDMDEILKRCGIILSAFQIDQLWTYHILLRQHNLELNLTRVHNFKNMVLKLYADSILPGQMMKLPSPLMDLGTGPGMPGIPLKIAYPELEIYLAESRGKRVEFLELVVERLRLKNIFVIGKSIAPDFEKPVNAVITRAVEDIPGTLDRISGCLSHGGLAVFMKGPQCDDEIRAAGTQFKTRFSLSEDIDYKIPHTPHERRLAVFRRLDAPVWEQRKTAMALHPTRLIESEQNSLFKDLKKLLTGRGIKKHQQALISGPKLVSEVLQDFPDRCEAWISMENQPPPANTPVHMQWYQMSRPLFKQLDVIGTDVPMLLVKTAPMAAWHPKDPLPNGCSLLIPFQDPENVGTVIRSAVAFGIENIVLLSESAHPYHPKSIRASGGAVFRANLFEGPSVQDLPANLPVLPLSAEGEDISKFKFPDTFGFLPGIEGPGLPDHFRSKALSIPIQKNVESLNAATAVGIALYIWSQSRGKNKSVLKL